MHEYIYIYVPAIIVSRWHCFLPPLEPGGEGKNAEGSQRDQAYQGGSGKFSLGLRESRITGNHGFSHEIYRGGSGYFFPLKPIH